MVCRKTEYICATVSTEFCQMIIRVGNNKKQTILPKTVESEGGGGGSIVVVVFLLRVVFVVDQGNFESGRQSQCVTDGAVIVLAVVM